MSRIRDLRYWTGVAGVSFREVLYGRGMNVAKLKLKSEAPELLNALMRQACAEIELVSQTSAARIGGESARSKPGGNPPKGSTNKGLDEIRSAYRKAESNWDRLKAIQRAQRLRDTLRGKPKLERRRGTHAWKLSIANDTRASALVGADFGVSASYVRKLRGELRRP